MQYLKTNCLNIFQHTRTTKNATTTLIIYTHFKHLQSTIVDNSMCGENIFDMDASCVVFPAVPKPTPTRFVRAKNVRVMCVFRVFA